MQLHHCSRRRPTCSALSSTTAPSPSRSLSMKGCNFAHNSPFIVFAISNKSKTGRVWPANPQSSLIAMCIYFFPKEKLHLISKYLSQDSNHDCPGYYIRWLIKNDSVYGHRFKGRWIDIGTPEAYLSVCNRWDTYVPHPSSIGT